MRSFFIINNVDMIMLVSDIDNLDIFIVEEGGLSV